MSTTSIKKDPVSPALHELVVIDFEASALEGGYPIELGWCDIAGNAGAILIRPEWEWKNTMRWDPKAEPVHGLTMADLERDGVSPAIALDRFLEALGGRLIVSDAPAYDFEWLKILFQAGGGFPGRMPKAHYDPADGYLLTNGLAYNGSGLVSLDDIQDIHDAIAANHKHTAAGDAAAWQAAFRSLEAIRAKNEAAKISGTLKRTGKGNLPRHRKEIAAIFAEFDVRAAIVAPWRNKAGATNLVAEPPATNSLSPSI